MKHFRQPCLVVALVVLLFGSAVPESKGQASFRGIGSLEGNSPDYRRSEVWGISPDGQVVVGQSWNVIGSQAFGHAITWDSDDGMESLGDLPGGGFSAVARDASSAGTVIVGNGWSGSGNEAFRFQNSMLPLGDFDGGIFNSYATSVSADGSVVAGYGTDDTGSQAFRWQNGTMSPLMPGHWCKAEDISGDGSVIVGVGGNPGKPFRWENGSITWIDCLLSGNTGSARGVTSDGNVVVGFSRIDTNSSDNEAFRWENGQTIGLGDLPGGDHYSWAEGVSGDGSLVVGYSCVDGVFASSSWKSAAFIWDESNGMRNLQDVLASDYGLDLSGWTLTKAVAISDDGRTIVGDGINPDGLGEGWTAVIPEPTCMLLCGFGTLRLLWVRRNR